MVLPCIGSHDHTTTRPSRFTARTSGGSRSPALSAPTPADQREPAGLVVRIEDVDQAQQLVGLAATGRVLRPSGFLMPRQILDMGMIELAGAVADPDHVAGGAVPVAAGRIHARHRLLEAEQQRLVAGVEIGRAQLRMALEIEPAGLHEAERLGDAVGELARSAATAGCP